MPKTLGLIATDLKESGLGLHSRVACELAGHSVLEHTLRRVAAVKAVCEVVVVHPQGQRPLALLGDRKFGKPVSTFAYEPTQDQFMAMRRAARKWAPAAWRGGLGGAACFDEILPAGPLVAAMQRHQADSAVLVGGDWPLVDPHFCDRVLERHLANPEAIAFSFTQAPPGLAGVAASRQVLEKVALSQGTFGSMLAYRPASPQADPIGRDPCVPIPHEVRSCPHRLIYDTPCSADLLQRLGDRLGSQLVSADASVVAQTVAELDLQQPEGRRCLPQQVTLELTPRRLVDGPIVPQHHVKLQRPDMPLDLALRIVEQLGVDGDTAMCLGGLGDALLYEHWPRVVEAAHAAGVLGIAIQSDLLTERPVLERLVSLPVDVLAVRLNADTEATYRQVMGVDRFAEVVDCLQWLMMQRTTEAARSRGDGRAGLPWLVPHLIKTVDTLGDMESFFDRWVHFAGAAVIEPATTGAGLISPQSPLPMAPPRRCGCRQIDRRMSILSNGQVALCDQDWLGGATTGDARQMDLAEIWQSMAPIRDSHRQQRWDQYPLCHGCDQWHRP